MTRCGATRRARRGASWSSSASCCPGSSTRSSPSTWPASRSSPSRWTCCSATSGCSRSAKRCSGAAAATSPRSCSRARTSTARSRSRPASSTRSCWRRSWARSRSAASGIYFAMITLGVAQIQYFSAFQLVDLTGGENGLQLSGRGTLFGMPIESDRGFYYLVLVLVALGVWFALRLDPLAVRRGAAGDARERAARDRAGLPGRPLQARGVQHRGRPGRLRRRALRAGQPARRAWTWSTGTPRARS